MTGRYGEGMTRGIERPGRTYQTEAGRQAAYALVDLAAGSDKVEDRLADLGVLQALIRDWVLALVEETERRPSASRGSD